MKSKYLQNYLNRISKSVGPSLADDVRKTAEDIGTQYLAKMSYTTNETGLLFGNVQSGKTAHMLGVLCRAADMGFPVFIVLTTDNNILQSQTKERIQRDLENDFLVCGEEDSRIFEDGRLVKPTIAVLKKNYRILRLWTNTMTASAFVKGNPLFIIDDEADSASLNTLVNKGRQSTINRYLDLLKHQSSCSMYLQVTGTPQALLLQTKRSGWHPLFTYYFEPGEGYLGGQFFFSEDHPEAIEFIDAKKNYIREVVIRHLAVSAQIFLSGGTVSNCLFHPSIRISEHDRTASYVKHELEWCRNNLDAGFKTAFLTTFETLSPKKTDKADADEAFIFVRSILQNKKAEVIILNGKNESDSSLYNSGCNFIIGGNTLGRGVTFKALNTVCYTRSSKKPNADTMWQHSRMFGYDRDPGMMKVYIDGSLYKMFSDINAANDSMTAQIEDGQEVKIFYPENISPTRNNVLDAGNVSVISGGVNYFCANPGNNTKGDISGLLLQFSETHEYYQVSLRLIREILSHIDPSDDFKLDAFLSVIDAYQATNSFEQGILIVRRNRDITQGTGALLSPNDVTVGKKFTQRIVLTMYQVRGTKGWREENLWVPNIKLPDKTAYYDVKE